MIEIRPDEQIQLLLQPADTHEPETRGGIGAGLAERYGGDLWIPLRPDRPTLLANFVETVDGVVSMDAGNSGGGDVSGHSRPDRFVMGLLRALADVIVVGASALGGSDSGPRTPGRIFPQAAEEFAALRAKLGLPAQPATLVLTASGNLDRHHSVFADPDVPVVLAGPDRAVERLRELDLPARVRIERVDGARPLGDELAALTRRIGARVVLSEAGPHLAAELVEDCAIDVLFLTISPQLAGRDGAARRLSLLEGAAFWPDSPRWLKLRSLRHAGDHLFLRYEFEESSNER